MADLPFDDVKIMKDAYERDVRIVCRVKGPDGLPVGTGFLIRENWILTCYHVYVNLCGAKTPYPGFEEKIRTNIEDDKCGVEFEGGLKVDFIKNDFFVCGSPGDKLDYAILELRDCVGAQALKDSPQKRGWLNLIDNAVQSIGDGNFNVQFVHYPQGNELKESKDGKLCGLYKDDSIAGHDYLLHDLESKGGSSGAPIVSRDKGKLVAIHKGRASAVEWLAIPITLIREHIQNEHPAVYKQLDQKVDAPELIPSDAQLREQLKIDIVRVILNYFNNLPDDEARKKYKKELDRYFVYSLNPGRYPKINMEGDHNTGVENMVASLMGQGLGPSTEDRFLPITKFLLYLQRNNLAFANDFGNFLDRIHTLNPLASRNLEEGLKLIKAIEQEGYDVVFIVQRRDDEDPSDHYSLTMRVYHRENSFQVCRWPSHIREKSDLEKAISDLWPDYAQTIKIKIGIPFSLLFSWNIDPIKLSHIPITLDKFGPVSYFSLERRGPYAVLLKTRWESIKQQGYLHIITNENTQTLHTDLDKSMEVSGQFAYVGCVKEEQLDTQGKQAVVSALLNSGVPAMIWSSGTQPCEVTNGIQNFNQDSLQAFPELLRTKALEQELFPNPLAFLLDRPEYYSEEGYL